MIKIAQIYKSPYGDLDISHHETGGMTLNPLFSRIFKGLESGTLRDFRIPKLKSIQHPKTNKLYLWVRYGGVLDPVFYYILAKGNARQTRLDNNCRYACYAGGQPFFRGIRNKTWKAYAIPKIEYIKD